MYELEETLYQRAENFLALTAEMLKSTSATNKVFFYD